MWKKRSSGDWPERRRMNPNDPFMHTMNPCCVSPASTSAWCGSGLNAVASFESGTAYSVSLWLLAVLSVAGGADARSSSADLGEAGSAAAASTAVGASGRGAACLATAGLGDSMTISALLVFFVRVAGAAVAAAAVVVVVVAIVLTVFFFLRLASMATAGGGMA